MHLGQVPRLTMQKHIVKKDGAVVPLAAIDKTIARKAADPEWQGEESQAGGRPSALSDTEKKALVALVFKMRGKAVVTVPFCRRKLPFLKKVSVWCCRRALHDAALAWLGRRCKSWVPPPHKIMRMTYSEWLKARHQATLDRFGYTDGTTWFLAVGPSDQGDKKRAALGKRVWRMSNGRSRQPQRQDQDLQKRPPRLSPVGTGACWRQSHDNHTTITRQSTRQSHDK